MWTNFFCVQLFLCGTHGIYIFFFFINWTLRMSDNLPERVQIFGHAHILCITVRENKIICCQIIFCDLLLKSAFERIFNIMQLILVKIKWHFKWKYWIQKFHDICLSYYFNIYLQDMNIKRRLARFEQNVYFRCFSCAALSPIIINYACPNFRTTCALTLMFTFTT